MVTGMWNRLAHRRRKYRGSSPNSLQPISYFGSILELTTPYVMFESKKTQILIEFLDGTKKVQLVGKKSSASV